MAGALTEMDEDDDLDEGFTWPQTMEQVTDPTDVLQDTATFLTDAHLGWQRQYLLRLARKIHRLVASNLTRDEETLFMLYLAYDTNLDGVVSGTETKRLLKDGKRYFTKVTFTHGSQQTPLISPSGEISFSSLLKWFSEHGADAAKGTLSLLSYLVGFAGSGFLQSDQRLESLDVFMLQHNVMGYRKILRQVREWKASLRLEEVQGAEAGLGQMQVGALYNDLVTRELVGDEEHLFSLFLEVDASGDLTLQRNEIVALLRKLDSSASQEEIQIYMEEMNIGSGDLSFPTFIDWWHQARQVPTSLVARKGTSLLANIRAKASARWLGTFFAEDAPASRIWYVAAGRGPQGMAALQSAYVKCFHDVREYHTQQALHNVEYECLKL